MPRGGARGGGSHGEDPREALRRIGGEIHAACVAHGKGEAGRVDYDRGANLAGFKTVADAMLAFGGG